VTETQLNAIFRQLATFATRDLGFLS